MMKGEDLRRFQLLRAHFLILVHCDREALPKCRVAWDGHAGVVVCLVSSAMVRMGCFDLGYVAVSLRY